MGDSEKVDVYITKWWQSRGVLLARGAEPRDGCVLVRLPGLWTNCLFSCDFMATYQGACERVSKLARKRLVSLHKEIARVESILEMAESGTLEVGEYGGDDHGR